MLGTNSRPPPSPPPILSPQKPPYRPSNAVTAYFNAHGGLVIKQEMWPDDDAIVIINATNIDTFIDRMTELLGYGSAGRL